MKENVRFITAYEEGSDSRKYACVLRLASWWNTVTTTNTVAVDLVSNFLLRQKAALFADNPCVFNQ